jgi:hypothetical protein
MASRKKEGATAAVAELQVSGQSHRSDDVAATDAAGKFVGQWNRLVSTTNWEKGRIICQWREALIEAAAPVTDYSDEAWSQLVGGVTSQHVGRLRRVYQRFGEVRQQYDGLYWSHFQASIEWQDAEMWLEGAIHNGWSVSQMRGKRWETLGKPGEAPTEEDAALADDGAESAPFEEDSAEEIGESVSGSTASMTSIESPAKRQAERDDADGDENEDAERDSNVSASRSSTQHESPKSSPKTRSRLGVEVHDLPDDLADAFEQFKLAIIAQRRLSWSETTPESVLECLDALRELTLAPLDD